MGSYKKKGKKHGALPQGALHLARILVCKLHILACKQYHLAKVISISASLRW
jgi:hypothetical protein